MRDNVGVQPPWPAQTRLCGCHRCVPGGRQDEVAVSRATQYGPQLGVWAQRVDTVKKTARIEALSDVQRQQRGRVAKRRAEHIEIERIAAHAGKHMDAFVVRPEPLKAFSQVTVTM